MSADAKLVFVLNGLGVAGSESKIVRVANALARSGTQVEIAYLDAREALLKEIDGRIPATCLRRRGKYSVGALSRLGKLIGSGPCVLVSVNLYPLLYALPAARCASPTKAKTVVLINTALVQRSAHRLGRIYSPLLRRCDRLIFGCQSEMRAWVDGFSLPVERSEYLYNGVDEVHFAPQDDSNEAMQLRQAHDIPRDALVIGSAGRLVPVKAFNHAIRAVSKLNAMGRPCFLALAGQGAERGRLEELAAECGIRDRVKFLGVMQDIRPALTMMDIFVLPSISETFSNAALEAMSMGTPVVLSHTGGAPEMIEHGKSGMLFRPGDIQELVDSLIPLVDHEDVRQRFGESARQRVLDLFRFSAMVDRYKQLASL